MNEEKTISKRRVKSLWERLLSTQRVDSSVVAEYNSLEYGFKKLFPDVSFSKYKPVKQLSKFERFFGSIDDNYQTRYSPIMNRLEHMKSYFPEKTNEEGKNITYAITNIENYNQIIEKMDVKISTKKIINNYVKDLEDELKKPKKDKKRIAEIIKQLQKHKLPIEILQWIITILLSLINV